MQLAAADTPLRMVKVQPEFRAGALMTSGYNVFGGIDGCLSGGIRLNKRHSVEADIEAVRIIEAIDDAPKPKLTIILGFGTSYLYAPVKIKDILLWEIGVRTGVAQDEMYVHAGYLGFPSRITIGNSRIAGYVAGMVSTAVVIDIVDKWWNESVWCANISTGIRFRL